MSLPLSFPKRDSKKYNLLILLNNEKFKKKLKILVKKIIMENQGKRKLTTE